MITLLPGSMVFWTEILDRGDRAFMQHGGVCFVRPLSPLKTLISKFIPVDIDNECGFVSIKASKDK